MIKRVVRDWLPRRHEIGFLQLESSTVSLPHSTDNISSPVLVLFQGKVLHTQSTGEVKKDITNISSNLYKKGEMLPR